MKNCKVCKIDKDCKFYGSKCNLCYNADRRAARKANPDKYRELDKARYLRDTDRILARNKKYRAKHQPRLREQKRQHYHNNKLPYFVRAAERRANKLSATPHWLTADDKKWIAWHYRHAKAMQDLTGIVHHVDHIIPLQGKLVCGLHTPYNLQVIPAAENIGKGNRISL